jgi:hypothetical protein
MSDETAPCSKCGHTDGVHPWTEGDCILPHHKTHSRATTGHICGWCVDRHKDWLREIVELYATLGRVVAQGSIDEGTIEYQKPRKKPASPALMRLDAWAMTQDTGRLFAGGEKQRDGTHTIGYMNALPDVPAVLATWTEAVIEAVGWTSTAPSTVTGCSALLTTQAEQIGHLPLVDDYDAELGWLRRSLRRAHGITDPQALGKCLTVTDQRECGGRVWPNGSENPKCDRCGRRYGTLDLVRLKVNEKREAS